MLGQQTFVQRENIGTMLANHHHTSLGPTKPQHLISLVSQYQPNIGKSMLGQQRFVQQASIGTLLANHHHTSFGPIKVQHKILLVG